MKTVDRAGALDALVAFEISACCIEAVASFCSISRFYLCGAGLMVGSILMKQLTFLETTGSYRVVSLHLGPAGDPPPPEKQAFLCAEQPPGVLVGPDGACCHSPDMSACHRGLTLTC